MTRSARSGFPVGVVLLCGIGGLFAAVALTAGVGWVQAIGYEQGWWGRPEDFEGGDVLGALTVIGAAGAGVLLGLGVRRGRRVHRWSRPATALVAIGSVVGLVLIIGFAASVR